MTRVPADGVHAFDDRGDVRLLIRIFDRAACEPLVALKGNPDQGARSDRRGRMRRHRGFRRTRLASHRIRWLWAITQTGSKTTSTASEKGTLCGITTMTATAW